MLKTNYSTGKYILLGFITLGIYQIYINYKISQEINIVAARDGKKTLNFLWLILLSPLTLGIALIIWEHKICNRMGKEASRRGLNVDFSASDFWLYIILPCLASAIPIVGLTTLIFPCIFIHSQLKVMNLLNADYNQKSE